MYCGVGVMFTVEAWDEGGTWDGLTACVGWVMLWCGTYDWLAVCVGWAVPWSACCPFKKVFGDISWL